MYKSYFFQQSFDHVDRGHLYEIWYTCLRLSEVCISHYQDVVLLCVYAGMVRCVLSRHSERSCLCSGLWHLLFRQLWVCQDHAAADLRDQVRDGNISLILFLHTFTSLHPSLFLLPFICLHLCFCLFPAFFLCWFISLMFINTSLLFLQCLMHLMQMRDPSVIMGCRHAGSFLHHLDPNQQKCLPFSSADCKGHVMPSAEASSKASETFCCAPE